MLQARTLQNGPPFSVSDQDALARLIESGAMNVMSARPDACIWGGARTC